MHQAKFSLTPPLIEFLNHYKQYGFKDKSSMVQAALLALKKEFEQQHLKQSANLYAEVYEEDTELQELTQTAIAGWPE
jgi:hypothetical protein